MDKHFTLSNRSFIFTSGDKYPVTIGQVKGCDILLPNSSNFEDQVFSKIEPNVQGDGWHIVRIAKDIPISINGVSLNRVHYLQSGDSLEFPGLNAKFNIVSGASKETSIVHIHKKSNVFWVSFVSLLAISGFVLYWILAVNHDNITPVMQEEIEASLFATRVDSLKMIHNDSVILNYSFASGPVGTAFLTTDSLIVTARHCIQPWLNCVEPLDFATLPDLDFPPVEAALKAETENQLQDSTVYKLITYLTLTDEKGEVINLNSEDFYFNTDFDDIVELGPYDKPLYWRSISHRYNIRDMMLGDIAVAKINKKGNISLANNDEIKNILKKRGVKITFFGYPESGVNGNKIDIQTDELRLPVTSLENDTTHLFMIAHGGTLTPGFSGGPAIVRNGMEYKAVGVISVVDEKNINRSYSVPTSEISFLYP